MCVRVCVCVCHLIFLFCLVRYQNSVCVVLPPQKREWSIFTPLHTRFSVDVWLNELWHTQHAYKITIVPDKTVTLLCLTHTNANKQRATRPNCPVVNKQAQSHSCVPHNHVDQRPQRQHVCVKKNDKGSAIEGHMLEWEDGRMVSDGKVTLKRDREQHGGSARVSGG